MNEIMLWKEKERSRISVIQMDSLRGLLGIPRIDRVRKRVGERREWRMIGLLRGSM